MNTTHFSNFEALRLITLALILCQGCDRSDSGDLYTAETTGTGGTIPSTTTDGGRGETSGARGTTGPDTTTGETSGGSADPLGELTDRGTVELPQDTLDPPICNDVCDSLGGTCTDAAAGYSYYDCQSESHGGNFYTCGYAEPAQYENDNGELCHLSEYSCRCHDVPLDVPFIDVTVAEDGPHTCDEICGSWDLTCAETGGQAFNDDSPVANLTCDALPPASATRYTCNCERP